MNRQERAAKLLKLFRAGVDSVGGRQATQRALSKERFNRPVHLVAVGKAADAMACGALPLLQEQLQAGLVITKHNHLSDSLRRHPLLQCIESGHPVPDEYSLEAGQKLCDFLTAIPSDHQLVFLVSGGTSALVERLNDGIDLHTLKQETDRLLSGGAPIGEINNHRRTLSRIKGGKLASFLTCPVLQLLISDVPGDAPGDIGSGLLVPDASTGMPESLPVWQQVDSRIIASSMIAQQAVADEAVAMGLAVRQSSGSLHGDVDVISQSVGTVIKQAQDTGVYIWGGEPTVVLPESPGRGGRNQHLALLLGRAVASNGAASVLVCGTDGSDGPTTDAGGLVDETLLKRALEANIDIVASLKRADAGSTLAALDALVTTGPTGTNVMDLAIALVSEASE